jgi:ribosomal protein L31E
MKKTVFKTNKVAANISGTEDTDTISKKRASLKSLMRRGKWLVKIFAFIVSLLFTSCVSTEAPEDNRNIAGKTATGEAVMVLDTAMVSAKLTGIDNYGTLVFNRLSAEDMPESGDIICSAPSKAAPQGFLYRVKEVTTRGNETTIVTEEATLEEAVEEAEVEEDLEMTISEIELTDGVEIEESELSPKSQVSSRASATLEVKIQKIKIEKKLDENIHIKGSIDIGAKVRCEVKIEWFQMKRFSLTTQPQFKAKLEATVESKIEKEIKINVATLKYSPVTVWVGVVPLVFTCDFRDCSDASTSTPSSTSISKTDIAKSSSISASSTASSRVASSVRIVVSLPFVETCFTL